MNWTALIMGGVLGVILEKIVDHWNGYDRVKKAIGDTSEKDLSVQHKDMMKDLGIQHIDMINDFSTQHKNMIKDLSTQHVRIEEHIKTHIDTNVNNNLSLLGKQIDSNTLTTTSIKEILIAQQRDAENQYANLTDKQKDIKTNIDAIRLMANDWERLNTQNKELKEEILTLKNQNQEMLRNIYELRRDIQEQGAKYNNLREDYKKLQENNKSLKNENERLRAPREKKPPRSMGPISF
jgi:chromosome segregation ATPase